MTVGFDRNCCVHMHVNVCLCLFQSRTLEGIPSKLTQAKVMSEMICKSRLLSEVEKKYCICMFTDACILCVRKEWL